MMTLRVAAVTGADEAPAAAHDSTTEAQRAGGAPAARAPPAAAPHMVPLYLRDDRLLTNGCIQAQVRKMLLFFCLYSVGASLQSRSSIVSVAPGCRSYMRAALLALSGLQVNSLES